MNPKPRKKNDYKTKYYNLLKKYKKLKEDSFENNRLALRYLEAAEVINRM